MDAQGFPLDLYLEVPSSKYLDNMSNDGTSGDEITLRVAAELFNIDFILVSTLESAAEVTFTSRNFSPQNRAFLGHSAENQVEHYVALSQIDNFESSEVVTLTLDWSIAFDFSTAAPSKFFGDLPPESIKLILLTAIGNSEYFWPSHVAYTFSALQSVCKFCRAEVDVTAMNSQVYFSHPDILPKSKGVVVRVNMQRIIRNARSFSGLVINVKRSWTVRNGIRLGYIWSCCHMDVCYYKILVRLIYGYVRFRCFLFIFKRKVEASLSSFSYVV